MYKQVSTLVSYKKTIALTRVKPFDGSGFTSEISLNFSKYPTGGTNTPVEPAIGSTITAAIVSFPWKSIISFKASAFSIPCLENDNRVIITEPYNKVFIKNLASKKKFHSSLKMNLPKELKFKNYSKKIFKEKFDLIVIALSLAGIDFIGKELKDLKIKAPLLVLTKGLKYDKKRKKLLTISALLKNNYNVANASIVLSISSSVICR